MVVVVMVWAGAALLRFSRHSDLHQHLAFLLLFIFFFCIWVLVFLIENTLARA